MCRGDILRGDILRGDICPYILTDAVRTTRPSPLLQRPYELHIDVQILVRLENEASAWCHSSEGQAAQAYRTLYPWMKFDRYKICRGWGSMMKQI